MDKDELEFGEDKGLHLVHMNVRSLGDVRKLDSLKIQLSKSDAHVIGLSETWLRKDIPSKLLEISGYSLARLDRSWKDDNGGIKRGGGVAIYFKNSLQASEHKYSRLNLSTKDIKVQWLHIKQDNIRPIVVLNIYRPPQGDCKVFCKEILDRIHEADLKDNTDLFILGDFNVDYLDKKNKDFTELNTTMKSLGLKQLIKGPTRFGRTKNSCLDLVFSNSDCISASGLINVNISDHFPVYTSRKKGRAKVRKTEFVGRSYARYDKERFQANLLQLDWETFYSQDDPNVAWGMMKENIELTIENMCPERRMIVKVYDDPWITREIIELIKDKDRLIKRAKISGVEEEWNVAKRARNFVSAQVRNLRAEFLIEEQRNNADDPKKFWRNISSILPKNKGGKAGIVLEEGGIQLDPGKSAGVLNTFFTNVGPTLAEGFEPDKWRPTNTRSITTFEECKTSFNEVLKLCKGIKIAKSSGYTHLSSKILKDSFLVLANQLTFLFNLSLSTSVFPEDWKSATIVPLYKGGPTSEVGNYRPVSLLPLPGKLLEKVVHSSMAGYLEGHELLTDAQNGFRRNRSTVSGIAGFTDDVLRNMNDAKVSLATFIDLRKAFDTVNHVVLSKKLEHMGVTGNILNWCISYLSKRSQKTVANGEV